MKRIRNRWVLVLGLIAFLFAQFAMITYACPLAGKTLPMNASSASLPADKLAQVKANSKFVVTLAERLDATGDAKDKAGTESNFQKLKGVLKTIRANYSDAAQK